METVRLLLVEDNSITAMDIQDRLAAMGYQVLGTFASADMAIQWTGKLAPDLVLMDIVLKGELDGIYAAQQIHARFEVPVVFVTAHSDAQTLERARLAEPYGYVLKPFDDRELHTAIEMALHKHTMESRLKESERWLAATLKGISDAVVATDADGCIKLMNPVAETLTGRRQADALGKPIADVVHLIREGTRIPYENPVLVALRQGTAASPAEDALLVSADGTQVPVGHQAAPIRDDEGALSGAVLVLRDISERRRAEQASRRYTAELETRNEELDAFAHIVAHDLKDPNAQVIGYAELLLHELGADLPPDVVRQDLQAIARGAHKVNSIIEELLLLAEVRQVDIERLPLDMGAIVAEALQRLEDAIAGSGAEIHLPEHWPAALGHAPWIEEVWFNYLNNALKFGGRPPRAELGATPEAGGMVRFWLRDNGPSLTPQAQAQVFAPFSRREQRRVRGRGLGLSLVQRIVEKLGGQVGVTNGAAGGCEFSFTLPAAPARRGGAG